MRIKNPFHVNGFALSHTLKQRLEVTQKWPLIILLKYNRLNNILSIVERHQLEKRTVPWAKKKIDGRRSQTSFRKRTETKDNKLNSFVESVMQMSKG